MGGSAGVVSPPHDGGSKGPVVSHAGLTVTSHRDLATDPAAGATDRPSPTLLHALRSDASWLAIRVALAFVRGRVYIRTGAPLEKTSDLKLRRGVLPN